MASLSDVQQAVLAKDSLYVGPIRVYAVNFIASNPFPRKFVYRGCTAKGKYGLCRHSIEGPPIKHCGHHALANGTFLEMFRFQLVLMDATLLVTYGVPTMRVLFWEGAREFLGLSAPAFASMDEIDQFELVHNMVKEVPLCSASFRVFKGVLSLQELEIVHKTTTLVETMTWSTPSTPSWARTPTASSTGVPAISPARTPYHDARSELTPHPRTPSDRRVPHTVTPSVQPSHNIAPSSSNPDTIEDGDDQEENTMSSVVRRLAEALTLSLDAYSGTSKK
ncbi:unnamed protein product [Calypogeia fissa]